MEKTTSFDLNEAVGRWRAEFGSPSQFNALELAELESHLRDHVVALAKSGLKLEAAFTVAVKQLGDRQRVATEFAKVNPQRIWLERALWMAAGITLFYILHCIAAVPQMLVFNHGFFMHWNPVVCAAVSSFCGIAVMAGLTMLCWVVIRRRLGWVRSVVGFIERRPLLAAAALVVPLWEVSGLVRYVPGVLERYLPRLYAWFFTGTPATYPHEILQRWDLLFSVTQNLLWGGVMCLLALRVVRSSQKRVPRSLWVERVGWMVAGWVFVRFFFQDLCGFALLPALLVAQPILGNSQAAQHVIGFVVAVLEAALWAMPFWACWYFTTRRPEFGGWVRRTLQVRPGWTIVGVMVLLNVVGIVGLLLLWTGIRTSWPGHSFGPVTSEWQWRTMLLAWRVFPALLLIALIRWRMKLREAW